jgi:uncharacterized protein YndB with AHSA1/START domain
MNNTQALGTFEKRADNLDVRFERFYPRPPETVWSALTDPTRLADWMGESRVEPRVGGKIEMMLGSPRPMTGRILVWQPPEALEFSWNNHDAPNSVIRYELAREGNGTRLVFMQKGMPFTSSALMLPGWHFLLESLGSALSDGGKPAPGWPQAWRELQTVYVEHYKLQGARLD